MSQSEPEADPSPPLVLKRSAEEMNVGVDKARGVVTVEVGEMKRYLSPGDAREMAAAFERYAEVCGENNDEHHQSQMLQRAADRAVATAE